MAVSKGLDFEKCLMYEAAFRIGGDELASNFKGKNFLAERNSSHRDVRIETPNIMDSIVSQINPQNATEFYQSFRQIGGAQSKTDIIFVNRNFIYKCSLKWGNTFKLSSSGVEGTTNFLLSTIESILKDEFSLQSNQVAKELIEIIEDLYDEVGTLGTQPSNIIQSSLSKLRNDVGIQSKLQQIFGSGRNPEVSEVYSGFKKSVIKESITGELTFKNDPERIANYILSGPRYSLRQITDAYIHEISNKSSIRIGAKGRSTRNNIRQQEIVLNLDVKDS